MITIASSIEVGVHPAIALIFGGVLAAVLRGKFASMALVIAPILGFWQIYSLELGSSSIINLMGY